MNTENALIACRLDALTPEEREREQELLLWFRSLAVEGVWTGAEHRIDVPADITTLSLLGKFFALERLCCPFLRFGLQVSAKETAQLTIAGPEGARRFVETTIGIGASQ